MKMMGSIKQIVSDVEKAYRNAATVSLSAVTLFLSLVAVNHRWITGRLAEVLPLALLFFLLSVYAFTLLGGKKRAPLSLVASVALTLLVYFLYLRTDQMSPVQALGYGGVLTLCGLASLLQEQTLKGASEEFVHRLSQAIQTILFGIVLYGGLAFLLLLIDRLIVEIPNVGRYYLDIFYSVALLFGVPFFFMRSQAERTREYPVLFSLLLDKVLIPLSYAYTLILYVFFARVLLTRAWPEGLVSHLVLWYSLFVVALMAVRRARAEIFGFKERFSLVVVPLMGVLFLAISIRIQAYGFTQNRILLVGAALWVTVSLLYLGFLKKVRPRVIVSMAIIFILVLMVLPLNAWALGARNQAARIEKTLLAEEMLHDGVLTPKATLSAETASSLQDSLEYLKVKEALSFVPYIPPVSTDTDFEKVFGVLPPEPSWETSYFYFHREEGESLPADGAKTMAIVSFYEADERKIEGIRFAFDARTLTMEKGDEQISIDIYEWAQDEHRQKFPFDWEASFGRVRLFLYRVDGDASWGKPIYMAELIVFFFE